MSHSAASPDEVRRSLTERQAIVFGRIAERRSYKEIAAELDISVARVGQYTQVLKQRFGVQTLGDLAQIHASLAGTDPLESSPSAKFNLPPSSEPDHSVHRDDERTFVFSDFAASPDDWTGKWFVEGRDRVVPGALDGERGTVLRLAYMLAIAVGLPAAVIMVIAAMQALSEILISA